MSFSNIIREAALKGGVFTHIFDKRFHTDETQIQQNSLTLKKIVR